MHARPADDKRSSSEPAERERLHTRLLTMAKQNMEKMKGATRGEGPIKLASFDTLEDFKQRCARNCCCYLFGF